MTDIDYALLDQLKQSGLWMVRNSNDGIGYGGFEHAPIGEWNECPRWTDNASCDGGGFFGQGPGGYGFAKQGNRFEFAQTGPERKIIDSNKIAARRMRIVYTEADALVALRHVSPDCPGSLDLSGTTLPEGFQIGDVGGSLDLSGTTLYDGTTATKDNISRRT